jgi:hypothetical protein
MACVDTISDALRGGMKLSPGALVSPFALARALRLRLCPTCCERPGLYGDRIVYNEARPQRVQAYQVARAACAYALLAMGLIDELTPHELAVALCGVDSYAFEEPRLARVFEIGERRRRMTRAV